MDEHINFGDLELSICNIDAKKSEIIDIYKNDLIPILNKSRECLISSSVDPTEFGDQLKLLFDEFDNSVSMLLDLLVDKIIPDYQDLSVNIQKLFNEKLGDQLTNLLGVENGK